MQTYTKKPEALANESIIFNIPTKTHPVPPCGAAAYGKTVPSKKFALLDTNRANGLSSTINYLNTTYFPSASTILSKNFLKPS